MLTTERHPPLDRPTSQASGGRPPVPRRPSSLGSNIDWLGIVVRHKSLLLLAVAIASALGYIQYSRQQPVYGSGLKLMITTQAPPTIVNGEAFVQPTSVGRYQTLLISELVLTKAAEEGDLANLETFRGNPYPAVAMRGMISVATVQGAPDTLSLSIKGPQPEELPQILTAVVSAFSSILTDDASTIGQSSLDLIKKLQEQVSEEKSNSESRYFELIQKLGLTPDPESGQFINPHTTQSAELHALRTELQREYRDVDERIAGIRRLQKMPIDQRTEMLKAVSIEAAKYLSLSEPGQSASLDKPNDELQDRRELLQRITQRVVELETSITESQARLDRMKRSAGINHPTVITLGNEVAIANSQLSTLLTQRSRVQQELGAVEQAINSGGQSPMPSGLALNQFDRDLIMIYLASLDREKDRLQQSLNAIEADIDQADQKAAAIAMEIDELNVLAREIDRKDTVIREILDRMSEMTVLASNHTSTTVRILDNPGIGYLVEPKLMNFMWISIFLGAAVGIGLGALLDWTELSFHNPDEIQEKLGTQVIARIPSQRQSGKTKAGEAQGAVGLVTVTRPQSSVAEAYRSCRAAMLFTAKQQGNKTFLITSPSAGDGKSTTATNIAMSLAQGGYKTVLVDADLRRPRCHMYLSETALPGLKELSKGLVAIDDVVRTTSLHANLSFVGTSKALEDPSEFLESKTFEELLTLLQKEFDYVIIDSPPVLPVADALSLSSRADAVLLVLRVRKGVVLAAQKAMESLRNVEANVIGVVVNSVDKSSHYSDYGRYGYKGYGGYQYYAQRYYGQQNAKYYREESVK